MSALRIVVTDSSVWVLDFAKSEFSRSPRIPGAEHPNAWLGAQYTGTWQPFDKVVETADPNFPERIRMTVYGAFVGSWITTTYVPAEQNALMAELGQLLVGAR